MSGEYSDEELVDVVASRPLAFRPGANYRYSNSGYLLLGFIVARVAGLHLGDFLAREGFRPLAMTDTVMVGRHAPTSAAAAAWKRTREQHPSIELFQDDGSHPSPAGSYLAGGTLFSALFDVSPIGLPGRVAGPPVDLETARVETDKTALLVHRVQTRRPRFSGKPGQPGGP